MAVLMLASTTVLMIPSQLAKGDEPTMLTNDRIGNYTLFQEDFRHMNVVPDNILFVNPSDTRSLYVSNDRALKVYIPSGGPSLKLILAGIRPVVKYTVEFEIGVNVHADLSEYGYPYFDIPLYGAVEEYGKMFSLSVHASSGYNHLYAFIRDANAIEQTTSDVLAREDNGYEYLTIKLHVNGYNHTYGYEITNGTESAILWTKMEYSDGLYTFIPGAIMRFFQWGASKNTDFRITYVKQYIERYKITAIAPRIIGDVVNWAEEEWSTEWIRDKLKEYNYTATWAPQPSNPNNPTTYAFFTDLSKNYGWEAGMMTYEALANTGYDNATDNITKDYQAILTNTGYAPKTFDSRLYDLNESHVRYAYEHFGMLCRQFGFPNLKWWNDWKYYHFYKSAKTGKNTTGYEAIADTGTPFVVFSDEVKDNATIYRNNSVSKYTYQRFLNCSYENGYKVMGWYAFWKILTNTYDFEAVNMTIYDGNILFKAETNGYDAYVSFYSNSTEILKVEDLTAKKEVNVSTSSSFWVKDGHIYKVYTEKIDQKGGSWLIEHIEAITWYQWLWILAIVFIIMVGVAIYASPKVNVLPKKYSTHKRH